MCCSMTKISWLDFHLNTSASHKTQKSFLCFSKSKKQNKKHIHKTNNNKMIDWERRKKAQRFYFRHDIPFKQLKLASYLKYFWSTGLLFGMELKSIKIPITIFLCKGIFFLCVWFRHDYLRFVRELCCERFALGCRWIHRLHLVQSPCLLNRLIVSVLRSMCLSSK